MMSASQTEVPGCLRAIHNNTGKGVVIVTVSWMGEVLSRQMWVRCRARNPGRCGHTHKPFDKGTKVYRPHTNSHNRGQRILASVIDKTPPPLDVVQLL